ncbi:MAG TPA: hypothetical protein VNV61_16225 [Steroidobacteraceae bacterium]|jgi:hypothetical protein|nr:hypothetical protein [Steroidobacteraceae bacterium]
MEKELFGIIGVVIGWLLTTVSEALRRQAERREKIRELEIQRGEELIMQCTQFLDWADSARKSAASGDIYVPIYLAGYRIFTIISLFYLSLAPHITALDDEAREYRLMLVDLATATSRGEFISQERLSEVNNARNNLHQLISELSRWAGNEIRARLN